MTASAHYKNVFDWADANTTLSPLRKGPMRKGFPSEVITFRETGAGTVEGKFNGGSEHLKRPIVQVLVRGKSDQYDAAHKLARDVYDELDSADISGYTSTRPQGPAPNELGPDGDGRYMFSVNIELQIDE